MRIGDVVLSPYDYGVVTNHYIASDLWGIMHEDGEELYYFGKDIYILSELEVDHIMVDCTGGPSTFYEFYQEIRKEI